MNGGDSGYIYIRNHSSYDLHNACKIGKTNNIPERDTTYSTGEIKRGNFGSVFEVCNKQMGFIENLLKDEFLDLNIKYDGGTEFYNKKIVDMIEPYLIRIGIKYKKLSKGEINDLTRCNRVRETKNKIKKVIKKLIQTLKREIVNKEYTPRKYQTDIIEKSVIHFENNEKGMLILPCGVGKTLISLWITESLKLNCVLIGVPNLLLSEQWKKEIFCLFKNVPIIIVKSGISIEKIVKFLEENVKKCIVITTYSSSYKVNIATSKLKFKFNMKINDEVHHLTSCNMKKEENERKYIQMLKIKCEKQLSLTATIKEIESNIDNCNVISNNNKKYFGEIIEKKSLLWAIKENIVCDYLIQTIIMDEERLKMILEKFNITEENDKRLFMSAFVSLKSISDGNSHHLLIYSNTRDNSLKIFNYIKILLNEKYFNIDDIYYSEYNSKMKVKEQKIIIDEFEKAKFGIISCVYCLGEGWDCPLLDGVVFSENMTSNIRIVQAVLRAFRKYIKEISKRSKIILPILNRNHWLEDNKNPDFKKIREVIYQLGLEDETISQKIKVFRINFVKQKKNEKEYKEQKYDLGEYDEELTRKLILKTIKRTQLDITYEKAKKIIADTNIKSKESYYELCDKDDRLPREPEIIFNGKFTNWIDYLSIERIYYDLETCRNKVSEYLKSYPKLKENYLDLTIISNELNKIDKLFPPNGLWIEYYNSKDLSYVINIKNNKKKIGVVL
jgi:superfamily II DNA or RNA helicase